MQLRFKKIWLFTTFFVYCASFFIQNNFLFFQTWAQEKNEPRVNIVAVLVDSKIYDSISWWLKSYTSYVQQNLSDTKALVIPLDLTNIHAYDIHRMMENIYFDGLKDVNSSLIWLIMFGDIPLPVVNQDWYIFPTVYPYVDFENQKYIWDSETEYFVPNGNPAWQAEIWHWLVNYWTDIQAYLDFFDKVENYNKNPVDFIWDRMWYDDFIAQKEGFLNENYWYYRNRVMFAEDLWYQRYSPLMKKMFEWEKVDDAIEIISELEDAVDTSFTWKDVLLQINDWWSDVHSTKVIQQEIDTSFVSDYNNLFSQVSSSTMRENVFAWWRWIKEYTDKNWEKKMISNSDSTASKIQLKDEILLWNKEFQWLIENLNDLMENMIDKKIEEKNISMDIVVPISYKKLTKKRILLKCVSLLSRYENFYFGNNARLIDSAEDLSIYRWTYRNLWSLSWVTYDSLLVWKNSIKTDYEKTNLRLRSIWSSYDIFSNQAEWNRWYSMVDVEDDKDVFYANRTSRTPAKTKTLFGIVKKIVWPDLCPAGSEDCEPLFDFVKRWWWWASAMNLKSESVSQWRYELSGFLAIDSWRPIYSMWWFQSLLPWTDEWSSWTWWYTWTWKWPQWDATSFKSYIKYASPTQLQWWTKSNWLIKKYKIFENYNPDIHLDFDKIDYWKLDANILRNRKFSKESGKIFNVSNKLSWCWWWWKTEYAYKVISSVVKHKSTTQDQINWINYDKYWENGSISKYYFDVKTEYVNVQEEITGALKSISELSWVVSSLNEYLNNNKYFSWDLSEKKLLLEDISKRIDVEKNKINDVYEFTSKISVENVISTLNFIVYLEWWKPEDYESWKTSNLVKIWFLPSWISDIKTIEWNIQDGKWDVIANYAWVYSLVEQQRTIWSEFKESLGFEDVNNQNIINEISEKMDKVFTIVYEWDEENVEDEEDEHNIDYGDEDEWGDGVNEEELSWWITLTWWTIGILMDDFDQNFDYLSWYFSKFIEEDKIWIAIVEASRVDSDFIKWLKNNSIKYKNFSEEEWISQYANWAKWPWYDSDWARRNHELLEWIVEHMSWMNILTPDRPIDSPRYVSMQSIAGNEIKFIYPDLYKVEVYTAWWKTQDWYDIHVLLTWWEIKKNLVKYLEWKVKEYNTIVQKECDSALKVDDNYFSRLYEMWFINATPSKSVHSCIEPFSYEDFVDAIWWEWMLGTISEVLYYQSLTNVNKLSTWNVAEDIELIKKSFNMNDKRAKILSDYLVEWNEKSKNLIFEVPTYEFSGYEVAFINSDWRDYIFPSDQINDYDETSNIQIDFSKIGDYQEDVQGDDTDWLEECNIPVNWTLPLFKLKWWKVDSPWLKWFKCWWEEVKRKPATVTLKFDNSLWYVLSANSFSDVLSGLVNNGELSQSFTNFWNEWQSLLNSHDWNNWSSQLLNVNNISSSLGSFEIKCNKKIVAGMTTPVNIVWYDVNHNVVSWWLDKFNFTVSTWRFLKDWAYQQSFNTNDFRNLNFDYQAPLDAVNWSSAVIQVKSKTNEVLWTCNMTIVQWNPVIKFNWKEILKGSEALVWNESYKLTSDESIYTWWKLNVSKLKKLEIDMNDSRWNIVDVDSQVLVTSEKWLLVFWKVDDKWNWRKEFVKTSTNYMKSGHVELYFYPTTVAGEDIINISIPWLDARIVNFKVFPAETTRIKFDIKENYVELGWESDFEIFASDVWWNPTNATLYISYDPTKIDFPNLKSLNNSASVDMAYVSWWYLKTEVKWVGAWVTEVKAGTFASIEFKVDKHILPESWLNILYLNYFGNDWWNQWWYFSDNDNRVESMMKKSNKIITTTTQLVSENKIKKVIWKMDKWFKITNFAGENTMLTMNKNKMSIRVAWLSEMTINSPSFKWMNVASLDTIYTLLNNKNSASNNYIFFVPSDSSYKIVDWVLYAEEKRIASVIDWEMVLKLENFMIDNWKNAWSLISNWINYGTLIVHYPTFVPQVNDFDLLKNNYLISAVFSKWSSDEMSGVWIFDWLSDFELDINYKSIQDSEDVDQRVWFIWDFKNITLFWEWEIVGEATKKFGSELLINLWDPVLSRKSKHENVYGTDYDWWIWHEIYTDSENDIFWVYQIDFNKDGLKDWLYVYSDWSLKLAKNYWWNPDLRNMQELMRIADRIKDVFVWDVNGDGYEDILVYANNNQIRGYLNKWWKFDVDWNVVCLNQNVFGNEISSTPSSMEWLNQFFVEDMDLDGNIDILTYDEKGYIKVFYGGSSKKGVNYLSNEKYACDAWWYERQNWNITEVTALWIQVSDDNIFDNSMMHWVGMTKTDLGISEGDLSEYGINFDPNDLEKFVKVKTEGSEWSIKDVVEEIMDTSNFDLETASKKFVENESKFVDVTLYENTLIGWWEANNYVFAPISFLDPNNPTDNCSAWKNYKVKDWWWLLMNWDIVTVRVTVKASDSAACIWSFWDIIQWPRNVYYDQNNIMKWIKFLQNQGNASVKSRDWNFSYLIDNIVLKPGEEMIFEYDLEYHQIPLRKMSVTYDTFWSKDKYPDIKLQCIDGCEKNFDWFVNLWKRSFKKTIVPLQEIINKEYEESEENTNNYSENVSNYWWNVGDIPWLVWNNMARRSLLWDWVLEIWDDENGKKTLKDLIERKIEEWGLEALNIKLDVDLSLFEEQAEMVEEVVDDITKWMCNGFSFGWSNNCKWLPVPFNQAFLAPGKYHLFGCWELPMWKLEDWIPSFFFPGTLRLPVGDVPIPWWLKNSKLDEFLWVGWWSYSSFIRIYAAPTLTAQLWVAVCMWPSAVANKLKSPRADVGWNCVVFAVKPQCSGWNDNISRKKDKQNPNEIYESFVDDVKDSWICLQTQKWPQVTERWWRSSPFNLYSYSSQVKKSDQNGRDNFNVKETWLNVKHDVKWWENIYVDWWLSNQTEFDVNFLWIISLETSAYVWTNDDELIEPNSIFVWDVDILWWDFTKNKIKWWIRQWVRSMLVDNRLDPQIRYIANQLTKMHVDIKLPDVQSLYNNEKQVYGNVNSNFGKIWQNDDNYSKIDTWLASRLGAWSYVNHDNLDKLNKSIWNPFESLAGLMNESNIINISVEPVTVKVPMVFAEDIDAYSLYLTQWLEVNQRIVEQWSGALSSVGTHCSKIEDEKEKELCYNNARKNLESFIEFENWDWQKMQNQIYANLMILQEYRNFPFEMYEWIHVIDRYMAEITSLINNTIWYLAYWTSTNSDRFVGYVDAIVLIANIIKTYQVLISFSDEWWKNCGTCSNDTYDQYSCKLSMLCNMIQLPIIQIPNFKLPNITLDLSNIDLNLDVVLPEFNFQPVKVDLPNLPNLPEPPSISANIKLFDLPNIPMLPEPPKLPELPSFIPEIELELPVLPPAPELPKLPNEIKSVIKVAKVIWKIYCIVKWQFGLVWESSVKAKIEQLTQRTYEVKWIDNIMDFTNWSVAPIHNYGLDYEISSYVDFQFNYSDFYDFLDTLTTSINNLTTSSVNWVNSETNDLENKEFIKYVTEIEDLGWTNVQLNIGMLNNSIDWLVSDEIEYTDYDTAKSRLKEVLSYFKNETKDTTMADSVNYSIAKIEKQIDKKNIVNPNFKWLEKLRNEATVYLNEEKIGYNNLAELIHSDYDWFLAMVDSWWIETKSRLSSGQMLTFNVELFDVDPSTRDVIKTISKDNLYGILLDNKKTIVDGYWNAINSNTYNDLWLSKEQYLVLRDNIWSVRNQVSTMYSVIKPVSSTQLIARNSWIITNKSLISANWWWERLWSNIKLADVVDPSVFSKWIYEKITKWADTWKLVKVVYSDSFVDNIWDRYYKTTHEKWHNIVLWNEDWVYLKCVDQQCGWKGIRDRWYYHSKIVEEIPYEETWLDFDRGTKLKIADVNQEVKNWKVMWQNYDNLLFSWKIEDWVDAYLIKLVDRIDYSYEKLESKVVVPYVLAVPRGTDLQGLYSKNIKLELLKKTKKIENLYWNDVVQVVYYDNNQNFADVIISNIDRKWYYARISALSLDGDTYSISSPWSNQVVAWKQIIWDDQAPSWNPVLYRPSTDSNVSEWDYLQWYVWTRYKLNVKWKDNAALYYINLLKDGKVIDEKYTSNIEDVVSADIIIHDKEGDEVYDSIWIDQFWNRTYKTINIHYSVPEITITDISNNSDWKSVAITAELSHDIDQWNVSFQRKRWNVWKTIYPKNFDESILYLKPWKTKIVWSPYSVSKDIAMYDKTWNVIAFMNPDTAEIKLQSGYVNLFDINVVVADGSVLQLYDKVNSDLIFSISLPIKECVKIEADNYNIVNLPERWMMWMYNWWKVVYKDWMNVLFVSPTGHLYSELWLEWTYAYDREMNAILLTLYQYSDSYKNNPIKLWLKVVPMTEN